MKRSLLPSLSIATAFFVFACSSPGAPSGSPATPDGSPAAPGGSPGASSGSPAAESGSPASLDGHTYLSTDLQGATLVLGTRVKLAFLSGGVNANAGCNTIGGQYTIKGSQFTSPRLGMTEIGCDGPRLAQDQWLANLLGNARITITGDALTMTDGTVTLTLVDKEVATPDLSLEGTHWVLDGIVSGDAVSSVPAGVVASIQINAGRADVMAGCNTGGGAVTVAGTTLTFGPIALTEMACEGAAMAVESAFVTTLAGPVDYAIDADVLTLNAGASGLTFRAAS